MIITCDGIRHYYIREKKKGISYCLRNPISLLVSYYVTDFYYIKKLLHH